MNSKAVARVLSEVTGQTDRRVIYVDSTPSTQDIAKVFAEDDAPAGTIVVTENQTNGRGRNSRKWYCPPGLNIAMSIILRPSLPLNLAPMMTLAAGLAAARGIAGVLPFHKDDEVLIKWPNDVVIDRKKVCGVLVETFSLADASSYFSIAGFGINVMQTEFPKEISHMAGSIMTQTGCMADREKLIAGICLFLERNIALIEKSGSLESIKADYEKRLANMNKPVKVLELSGDYEGKATGIDSGSGALIVEPSDGGERKLINSGEVSVRGIYGYV